MTALTTKQKSLSSGVLALIFAMNPCLALALPVSGTGSYGDFSPKAFVEAAKPWTVYRMSGKYSKNGFPCDSMGTACSTDKDYTITPLRAQVRRSSIDVGVGMPIGTVVRHESGSIRSIEIKNVNGLVLARLDGNRTSSRLGGDASASTTASRSSGDLYGSNVDLGHIESKDAAWAKLNPH